MDYEAYRRQFFADPPPEPRFDIRGIGGASLFVADYAAALTYYTAVLGPPDYVEGDDTRGWRLGSAWLTLFPAREGGPQNTDVQLEMATPTQAERLHGALIEAGGTGPAPSNELMYIPMRFCCVTDPFGSQWVIYAPLPQ
jgi:uncharacterized glyoxalase superfamily protein PhnB